MGDPLQELRGTDNRGTADRRSGDKVVRGVMLATPGKVLVMKRSDYFDNVFTTIRWLPILHTYVLEFDRGGKTFWIEVPGDKLGWTEKMQHPMQFKGWTGTTKVVTPYEYYADPLAAMFYSQEALSKALKVDKAAAEATAFVSFYRETPERGSVIVPTHYTRTTAPRLFAALHQLHAEKPIAKARQEAYGWWGESFRMGANAVTLNRIGLQMNAQGEIEPAIDPLDRLPKTPKVPGSKSGKGKQAGGKGSALDSLGPLGNAIRTIAGTDKKALAAAERMAERGHKGLLQDIAGKYKTSPKDAQELNDKKLKDGQDLLKDIGKLNDKKLDGLNAIREAVKTGDLTRSNRGTPNVLDWHDFYRGWGFPKKHRDEILSLVGDIHSVVISGLPATLSMAMRVNPHDIAGTIGALHAAAHLKQRYAAFNPRMRLEERVTTPAPGGGTAAREVDIMVIVGRREIHHEVKTYQQISIRRHMETQMAKDLLNHWRSGFADLKYLFSPGTKRQLYIVRNSMLAVFDSQVVPILKRSGLKDEAIADIRKKLQARLKDDLVGTFDWVSVR